ncbi:hypothetical protein IWX90DRAFT_499317 [Phyllosticta citrichinensis]|uniref:Uncharacterized protein n=1 Tax=Phyllosticta citrichinensis TaxID=1130410 RepID=A0ABR1XYR0_9PEZI
MAITLLMGQSTWRHGGFVEAFAGHGAMDGLDRGMSRLNRKNETPRLGYQSRGSIQASSTLQLTEDSVRKFTAVDNFPEDHDCTCPLFLFNTASQAGTSLPCCNHSPSTITGSVFAILPTSAYQNIRSPLSSSTRLSKPLPSHQVRHSSARRIESASHIIEETRRIPNRPEAFHLAHKTSKHGGAHPQSKHRPSPSSPLTKSTRAKTFQLQLNLPASVQLSRRALVTVFWECASLQLNDECDIVLRLIRDEHGSAVSKPTINSNSPAYQQIQSLWLLLRARSDDVRKAGPLVLKAHLYFCPPGPDYLSPVANRIDPEALALDDSGGGHRQTIEAERTLAQAASYKYVIPAKRANRSDEEYPVRKRARHASDVPPRDVQESPVKKRARQDSQVTPPDQQNADYTTISIGNLSLRGGADPHRQPRNPFFPRDIPVPETFVTYHAKFTVKHAGGEEYYTVMVPLEPDGSMPFGTMDLMYEFTAWKHSTSGRDAPHVSWDDFCNIRRFTSELI